jgi:hypothetical protein
MAGGCIVILVALALSLARELAFAQTGGKSSTPQAPRARLSSSAQSELSAAETEIIRRMKASRDGYEKLLTAYEEELRSQSREVNLRRKLHEKGQISKSVVERGERGLANTRAKIEQVKQWMVEDDLALAEALAREEMLRGPTLALGGYSESKTLIHFNGRAKWSLADMEKIEQFFLRRFGRLLPISAKGQTTAHERMRFDHHDAIDVAVHPDSVEGRALMAHLRQMGVPFIAFRTRVARAATGAHIHIGKPSLRQDQPPAGTRGAKR